MFNNDTPGKFVSAFIKLAEFAKRQPKASIGTLIALIMTILILLLSYRAYLLLNSMSAELITHIESQRRINPEPEDMQKIIEDVSNNNTAVDNVLSSILKVGGDRAYVMKFHNGSRDTNGMHFLYMSTTNEKTAPGIQNAMSVVQDIQTSMLDPKWLRGFIDGKCIEIKQTELETTTFIAGLMKKIGISQMHLCPIRDTVDDHLLGVSGVSWVSSVPTRELDDKVDQALFDANLALASLLTPAKEIKK